MIYQAAMRLLARREYSRVELERRLQAQGYAKDDICNVIDLLIEKNLQSDDRYVENYIRYRSRAGFGPIHIQLELRQKGISNELIDHCLTKDNDYWCAQLKIVWQKKYNQLPASKKEHAQQYRFLLQRGFMSDMIQRVLTEK